jgi:light-regulated signal transduction histidine kinase (bacteriophytochrome)
MSWKIVGKVLKKTDITMTVWYMWIAHAHRGRIDVQGDPDEGITLPGTFPLITFNQENQVS